MNHAQHAFFFAVFSGALVMTASCVGDSLPTGPESSVDGGDGGSGDGSGSIDAAAQGDAGASGDSSAADAGVDAAAPLMTYPTVGVGDGFACALRPSGKVYCWGDARCGQVGAGVSQPASVPPTFVQPWQVAGIPAGNPAALLAVGREYACVVLADRTVSCWGENEVDQLGHINTGDATGAFCTNGSIQYKATATPIAGLTDVIDIAAGLYHTCVRKSDNSVWCWGANDTDQLGYANTSDGVCFGGTQCNPTPTKVKNVVADQLAVGAGHTCVRTGTTALCWGNNQYAQLGHLKGSNSDVTVAAGAINPTPLQPKATGITGLFAGGYNTCMVDGAQKVSCWGNNAGPGELPGFANPTSADPVVIPGVPAAVSYVAPGYGTNCAIWGNYLSCWGENTFGESGQADAGNYALPNQINGFLNPIAIASKYYGHCALTGGGSVYCWGPNSEGESGHDNSTDLSCGNGCKYNPNPTLVANLP